MFVVAGFLVLGALEGDQSQAVQDRLVSEPRPVQIPRLTIRADLEKTPLTYLADYWAQLAESARPSLASVGRVPTPAIVVGPRLLLTTIAPALEVLEARNRRALTRVDGTTEEASQPLPERGPHRLRAWDPEIGLALFDIMGDSRTPFTLTEPRVLPSGSYVGAVTLGAQGEPAITPGYLVTVTSGKPVDDASGDLVVSMDLPETLPVAAVVNLDGALLGMAYRAPTGRRVISSTEMLGLIERLQTGTVCRSVEVTDLDESVRELLVLETGVLIEHVRMDAFDPEPSLRGGDVLLEWAGERVDSAEQFRELYDAQTPGELVQYRVLRNRRRISGGTVLPGTDCEPVRPDPVRLIALGLAVEWVPETHDGANTVAGWRVVAVTPDGLSAVAGIEEQDRLLAVDGAPVTEESDRGTIERVAERSGPLLLSLERGNRMKLVAVAPAAQ